MNRGHSHRSPPPLEGIHAQGERMCDNELIRLKPQAHCCLISKLNKKAQGPPRPALCSASCNFIDGCSVHAQPLSGGTTEGSTAFGFQPLTRMACLSFIYHFALEWLFFIMALTVIGADS